MPGVKISNLPASATPLSGTEILPIVKSGSTVQVSVDNLTAGRAINVGSINTTSSISAASLSLTTTPLNIASGGTNGTATPTAGSVAIGTGTALSYTTAGTSGQFLNSNGSGTPTWVTPAWASVVPVASGGTNITSYTTGDIIYASTSGVLSKLADVATGNVLISGGVGVAPNYGQVGLTSHVSGILPVANGGTNASVAGITAFNNITGYTASGSTGVTSTNLVFSSSPTFVGTITASAITASSGINVTAGSLCAASKLLIGGPTSSSFTQGLQLYGNTSSGPQCAIQWGYGTGTGAPPVNYMIRTRGTTATATTAVINGDVLGNIGFAGTDGSAVVSTANMLGIVDGAVLGGQIPTALAFYTGTTGALLTLNLASSRVVTMPGYGAGTATFSASGVISSVSDETYKIKDGVVADPMPMIMALEPGYYFGKPEANMGPGRQLGFYAQNVRAAIGPEAAPDPESTTAEDGTVTTKPWGYFDRSVLAVAVDAIKVQQAQIIALTARIEALEART